MKGRSRDRPFGVFRGEPPVRLLPVVDRNPEQSHGFLPVADG